MLGLQAEHHFIQCVQASCVLGEHATKRVIPPPLLGLFLKCKNVSEDFFRPAVLWAFLELSMHTSLGPHVHTSLGPHGHTSLGPKCIHF